MEELIIDEIEVVEANNVDIIINQTLGEVTTNFEIVKAAITKKTETYKNVKVTEINKSKRKKDIANLRKDIKYLNEKRIEVKNECLKPYVAFEEKVKELIDIYNIPVNVIDNQVKELEENQRLTKKDEITQIYNSLIGSLLEKVPLSVIYDTKWENVATSAKSIKEDLTAKIASINQDVAVINSMVSDKTEEALEMYWDDLTLAKAISFINNYEKQKKEIQARLELQQKEAKEKELEAERERIKRETRQSVYAETSSYTAGYTEAVKKQESIAVAEHEAMAAQKQESGTINATYTFEATENELKQIEMYCSSIGVDFERVI